MAPRTRALTLLGVVPVVAASLVPASSAAEEPPPHVGVFEQRFGSVGLLPGQTARINVAADVTINPADPDCEVRVAFVDGAGEVSSTEPGQTRDGSTVSRDYHYVRGETGGRRQVRAVVTSINPADPDRPAGPCPVLSTLEVFGESGETSLVVLPAVQRIERR